MRTPAMTDGDDPLNGGWTDGRCPHRACGPGGLVGYERTVVLMSSVALAWLLASAALLPALGRLMRAGSPPVPDLPAAPPSDARPGLRLVPDLVG